MSATEMRQAAGSSGALTVTQVDDVLVVAIDVPGRSVNTLGSGMVAEFEEVLERMTKRWALDEVVTNTGKPCEIYYLTRLKKSIPRDVLLTAIHENANGIIESADLETGQGIEDKDTTKA